MRHVDFDEVWVRAGEQIAVEGSLCHQFFVVVAGRLETCRGGARGEMSPGDDFGWAAMRDRGVNDASVRALTDARLLVMSHAQFRAVSSFENAIADVEPLDGWRYRRGSSPRAAGMGRRQAS